MGSAALRRGLGNRRLEVGRAARKPGTVVEQVVPDPHPLILKVGPRGVGWETHCHFGKLAQLDDSTLRTIARPRLKGVEELIAYARGLVEIVASHAAVLQAEGLPADIGARLAGAIQGIVTARDARAEARLRSVAAKQAIQETHDRADKAVAALEAIADNTPSAHPEVLAKLRAAMRVGPRTAEAPAKPASPVPAAATSGKAA